MYKFLDNIATADVAFEVENHNFEQLFIESAEALFAIMADLSTIQPSVQKTIKLKSSTADRLLFDWLSELVYLKDKDYFLFSKFKIVITKDKEYSLKAEAWGEKIDPQRHNLKVDVKAVTYHMFYLKQENGLWKAQVILDI